MFSTAKTTSVSSCIRAMPFSNPLAYSRCQRKAGWTTIALAPRASAISLDRTSLPQGSRPQTRWVRTRQGEWIAVTGIW